MGVFKFVELNFFRVQNLKFSEIQPHFAFSVNLVWVKITKLITRLSVLVSKTIFRRNNSPNLPRRSSIYTELNSQAPIRKLTLKRPIGRFSIFSKNESCRLRGYVFSLFWDNFRCFASRAGKRRLGVKTINLFLQSEFQS